MAIYGACLIDLGDLVGARKALQSAIKLAPENPENFVNLSELEIKSGAFSGARAAAEAAIDRAPKLPQALNALGNAHYALRDYILRKTPTGAPASFDPPLPTYWAILATLLLVRVGLRRPEKCYVIA